MNTQLLIDDISDIIEKMTNCEYDEAVKRLEHILIDLILFKNVEDNLTDDTKIIELETSMSYGDVEKLMGEYYNRCMDEISGDVSELILIKIHKEKGIINYQE